MTTCIICGCSEFDPCIIERTGETCGWIEIENDVYEINGKGLCNFCAEDPLAGKEAFGLLMHQALQRGLLKPTDSERDEPLVELVSDSEADRFLRARRASA